jgi:hypothetical protein
MATRWGLEAERRRMIFILRGMRMKDICARDGSGNVTIRIYRSGIFITQQDFVGEEEDNQF